MTYFVLFNLGIPSITAYNKNGVKIDFNFQKVDNNPANILDIALIVSNALAVPVTDFVFQAAVPKVGYIISVKDHAVIYARGGGAKFDGCGPPLAFDQI